MQYDAAWMNGVLVRCEDGFDIIQSGTIAVKADKIAWIGPSDQFPKDQTETIYDLANSVVTPGLIDCHTHIIYAGNRSFEFEMRLQGKSYEEIHAQGGGINYTVAATRNANREQLLEGALLRAKSLMKSGVTTLEIKSGYGLDVEQEIKLLEVAHQLEQMLPITIFKTFLGAHTVPCEFKNKSNDYVKLLCDVMLPMIAERKLADAVDVFCETIGFNLKQTEAIFQTAKRYHLPIKCHADQLSDLGASELAIRYQALSVDHLEYLSKSGLNALSTSNTVAVLLPGAYYFLQEKQQPPIKALREHQIRMAVASDCNPGTSPVVSILAAMNLACVLFKLTPEEALLGVTKHAAAALGLEKEIGSLTVGKQADFAVWNVNEPKELSYYLGYQPLQKLIKKGKVILEIN